MGEIWPTDFAALLNSNCLELVPILESPRYMAIQQQIAIYLSQTGFSVAEQYLELEHHDPSSQCSLRKNMQDYFVRKKKVKKKEKKPN